MERCLALAEVLEESGAKITFISRHIDISPSGFFENKIIQFPFRFEILDKPKGSYDNLLDDVYRLHVDWHQDAVETRSILQKEKFDLLIVDHYSLDYRWESMLRQYVKKILVIDDLADRRHDCDILLNSVCGRLQSDYSDLVNPKCQFLLGTEFVLLRKEMRNWRSASLRKRKKSNSIKRILVSMGGVDEHNLTGRVLAQLSKVDLPGDSEVNVIVGSRYPYIDKLKSQIKSFANKITLDIEIDDMAQKIYEADIGIGAFGVSTWERCCLGLPSINIISEANQFHNATALIKEEIGEVVFAESINCKLVPAVKFLIENQNFRHQISKRASKLVDGKGVYRVVERIMAEL